jgi:hypothetical protein
MLQIAASLCVWFLVRAVRFAHWKLDLQVTFIIAPGIGHNTRGYSYSSVDRKLAIEVGQIVCGISRPPVETVVVPGVCQL